MGVDERRERFRLPRDSAPACASRRQGSRNRYIRLYGGGAAFDPQAHAFFLDIGSGKRQRMQSPNDALQGQESITPFMNLEMRPMNGSPARRPHAFAPLPFRHSIS
jgi:hypothetical protein